MDCASHALALETSLLHSLKRCDSYHLSKHNAFHYKDTCFPLSPLKAKQLCAVPEERAVSLRKDLTLLL